MELPDEQCIRPKSMTWLWWEVINTWNKKCVLLQATHWWKCMLPTGPKPREKPNVEHSVGLTEGTEADRFKDTLAEHASSEEGRSYVIDRTSQFIRGPCTCAQYPKVKLKISCSSSSPRHTVLLPLNGCHQDAGHQGHDHTLHFLWESFWWPGMTNQVQQSIKSCMNCLQNEGNLPKVPLHLIMSTIPMDLLHVDFTSIKTTMELNRPPRVANILVFQNHFTKHVMAYVWPLTRLLRPLPSFCIRGTFLIFGAPARFLSDWGVNFISSIIGKMCKLLGMKKFMHHTLFPQTNALVERSHQTIMWMIGKLGEDKKPTGQVIWLKIVHAYNASQSTVMGYSPHYLMFGHRPRLPVDFYFPTLRR